MRYLKLFGFIILFGCTQNKDYNTNLDFQSGAFLHQYIQKKGTEIHNQNKDGIADEIVIKTDTIINKYQTLSADFRKVFMQAQISDNDIQKLEKGIDNYEKAVTAALPEPVQQEFITYTKGFSKEMIEKPSDKREYLLKQSVRNKLITIQALELLGTQIPVIQ